MELPMDDSTVTQRKLKQEMKIANSHIFRSLEAHKEAKCVRRKLFVF
jgi:hypothetical protein